MIGLIGMVLDSVRYALAYHRRMSTASHKGPSPFDVPPRSLFPCNNRLVGFFQLVYLIESDMSLLGF